MEKRNKIFIAASAILIIVLILVYTFVSSGGNSANIALTNLPVSQADMSALSTAANNMTLADKIGVGAIGVFPNQVNGSLLADNGSPEVFYAGGDHCPFCAATRWSLIIALMRFGTFTNLHYMTSSSTDVYASTPTFTFYNSIDPTTYTSQYISFTGLEIYDQNKAVQNQPNAEQTAIIQNNGTTGSIPFIDFGNRSVQQGADYSPGLINQLTYQQIISQLDNTNSTVAQSIIGGADVFTAQICRMDGFKPASVCDAPYIGKILNMS